MKMSFIIKIISIKIINPSQECLQDIKNLDDEDCHWAGLLFVHWIFYDRVGIAIGDMNDLVSEAGR